MRSLRTLAILGLCALIFSANDGWKLPVQIFAWAKMFHSFSQVLPISEALTKTFSGKAPCRICKHLMESARNKRLASDLVAGFNLPDFVIETVQFTFRQSRIIPARGYLAPTPLWQPEPSKRPPRIAAVFS